jgi:HEAT repeat protein
LPLAEERLTKADIPSDLPPDLKKELASTFDADPKGRAKAAEAIGKRGVHAAAAVPFLIRLLRDDAEVGEMPHTVSFSAWTALAAIGRPAVEACLSALKRSSGEPRESLILVLGSIRDPRAIDTLASLLENPSPSVRCQAVWALTDFDDRRVVPPLLRAVKDDDDRVRENATRGLGSHRDPDAVGPLIACLKDKNLVVRREAATSLGRQADRRAAPALLRVLHDGAEENAMRFCAACSLGEIADPSGHEALLAVLNDRSLPDDVRCGAASGLGASGDGSYVERLTVLATEAGEARNVRAHAIEGVVRLQGQKAVPLLKSLVKKDTTDDGVRFSAAVPLVKLTSGAVDDLDTVYALRGPCLTEVLYPNKARTDALRSVAEHGRTAEIRATAQVVLKETGNWQDELEP